jgi:hypothetical protein
VAAAAVGVRQQPSPCDALPSDSGVSRSWHRSGWGVGKITHAYCDKFITVFLPKLGVRTILRTTAYRGISYLGHFAYLGQNLYLGHWPTSSALSLSSTTFAELPLGLLGISPATTDCLNRNRIALACFTIRKVITIMFDSRYCEYLKLSQKVITIM